MFKFLSQIKCKEGKLTKNISFLYWGFPSTLDFPKRKAFLCLELNVKEKNCISRIALVLNLRKLSVLQKLRYCTGV